MSTLNNEYQAVISELLQASGQLRAIVVAASKLDPTQANLEELKITLFTLKTLIASLSSNL